MMLLQWNNAHLGIKLNSYGASWEVKEQKVRLKGIPQHTFLICWPSINHSLLNKVKSFQMGRCCHFHITKGGRRRWKTSNITRVDTPLSHSLLTHSMALDSECHSYLTKMNQTNSLRIAVSLTVLKRVY